MHVDCEFNSKGGKMRKMLSVSKRKDFHAGDQALQILVIIIAIFKYGGGRWSILYIYGPDGWQEEQLRIKNKTQICVWICVRTIVYLYTNSYPT